MPTVSAARMPVAVIGSGAIGRMHVERMLRHPDVAVAGIADPSPAARDFAAAAGVPFFQQVEERLDRTKPGAAIVATPNSPHADIGIACIGRGLPLLMEKPVADSAEEGRRLCDAARGAGVPLMVGHRR